MLACSQQIRRQKPVILNFVQRLKNNWIWPLRRFSTKLHMVEMNDEDVVIIKCSKTAAKWNLLKVKAGYTDKDNRFFCNHLLDLEETRQTEQALMYPECHIKEMFDEAIDDEDFDGTTQDNLEGTSLGALVQDGALSGPEQRDLPDTTKHKQSNNRKHQSFQPLLQCGVDIGQLSAVQDKNKSCSFKAGMALRVRSNKENAKQTLVDKSGSNFVLQLTDTPGQTKVSLVATYRKGNTIYIAEKNSQKKGPEMQKKNCDMCSGTFSCESLLEIHKRIKHNPDPFTCMECKLHFATARALLHHNQIHHPSGAATLLSKTNSNFTSEGALSSVEQFQCDSCERKFVSGYKRFTHKCAGLRVSHDPSSDPNGRLYVCTICSKQFKGETSLDRHMRVGNHDTYDKPKAKTMQTAVVCEACGERFYGAIALEKHNNMVHLNVRPYACEKCQASFFTKVALTAHGRKVHDEKQHKCDICGEEFELQSLLEYHKNSVHLQQKPFACGSCSLDFYSKLHLNQHIRSIHEDKKPYKCFTCNARFATLAEHNDHRIRELRAQSIAKHGLRRPAEDLPPFICKTCGKPFPSRPNLELHKNMTHRGVKNFTCYMCNSSFGNRRILKVHLKAVHNEELPVTYPCGARGCCKQRFESMEALNAHKIDMMRRRTQTATGEQGLHHCPDCGRVFPTRRNMKRHQLVHSKIKNFVCRVCERAFTHRKSLKAHMFSAHNLIEDLSHMRYPGYTGRGRGRHSDKLT